MITVVNLLFFEVVVIVVVVCSSNSESQVNKKPGGGGYCHMWTIWVYAAVKGMVFKQITLG